MKNLFLVGLAIVLFTSCNTKPERYTQQSPEIETYKAALQDYNNQNWESLVSRFADTANVFFNTTVPMRANKIPDFHQNNDKVFSSRGFVEEGQEYEMTITDEGKTWVNFWGVWKGTLAENNKELEIPVHLTAQFIDGKIVREYGYWDNAPIVLAIQGISENLSIIDGLYKDFSTGEIPAVLAVMDANIVWNEAEGNAYADGNPYIGPDAILKGVFARVGADFEYFNLSDIKLHEMSNDQVLATLRYKAKIKENGAIYDAQVAHHWTLKDGKITGFQQYVDTKKLADAFAQ